MDANEKAAMPRRKRERRIIILDEACLGLALQHHRLPPVSALSRAVWLLIVILRRRMAAQLPIHKLKLTIDAGKIPLVLVSCGSFNPPTLLHTRIMEEARDTVNDMGKYEAPLCRTMKQFCSQSQHTAPLSES